MIKGKAQTEAQYVGPLYAQVAVSLRRRIFDAEWSFQKPIPNEMVLAQELRVSVGTVRKAMEILEDEGLIERLKGRGTFVVEASDKTYISRFSNLYLDSDKVELRQAWSEITKGAPTDDEMRHLKVSADAEVMRLNRLMLVPGRGQVLETIAVPSALFPELESIEGLSSPVLFHLYRKHYDVIVQGVEEWVSAVTIDEATATALRKGGDRSTLKIERVARSAETGPVEYSVQYVNSPDLKYMVTMS